MKLSYKPVGAAGSWTVLFDETAAAAGPVLPEWKPEFNQPIQQQPLFRSPAQFRAARNNTSVSHPLTVFITYATLADAFDSVKTWSDLLGNKYHFKAEQGAKIHYYPNALLTNYTPNATGVTVQHTFTFISDKVIDTEPT